MFGGLGPPFPSYKFSYMTQQLFPPFWVLLELDPFLHQKNTFSRQKHFLVSWYTFLPYRLCLPDWNMKSHQTPFCGHDWAQNDGHDSLWVHGREAARPETWVCDPVASPPHRTTFTISLVEAMTVVTWGMRIFLKHSVPVTTCQKQSQLFRQHLQGYWVPLLFHGSCRQTGAKMEGARNADIWEMRDWQQSPCLLLDSVLPQDVLLNI